MAMTAKQAAAMLRSKIRECTRREVTWTLENGTRITACLPGGLVYVVRATKKGVNVTIEDGSGYPEPSYIDKVTGGDRRAFGVAQGQPVIDEVDKLRGFWPGGLPGETKFGMIIIVGEVVWREKS